MRWQLSGVNGRLGSLTAAEALANLPPLVDIHGQSLIAPALPLEKHERLYARLARLLDTSVPNWVFLPHHERERRSWWETHLGQTAEVAFGRAGVTLALCQLNRLGQPGRFIAVDEPTAGQPGIEGVLALDWAPAEFGLSFEFSRMDGRLDGKTDVSSLLELARKRLAQPDVFLCPGTGGDGYLERLLPFLSELGRWAEQQVRWEFPEAALGRLGVVGSLYGWAWLEAGYRLGDWAGPSAVMDMDESPLVGLTVVNWTEPRPDSPGTNQA